MYYARIFLLEKEQLLFLLNVKGGDPVEPENPSPSPFGFLCNVRSRLRNRDNKHSSTQTNSRLGQVPLSSSRNSTNNNHAMWTY
jgi:hypothetical protein